MSTFRPPTPVIDSSAIKVIWSVIDSKIPGGDPGYVELNEGGFRSVIVTFALADEYQVRTWRLTIIRPPFDAGAGHLRPRVFARTVRPDPKHRLSLEAFCRPPLFISLPEREGT